MNARPLDGDDHGSPETPPGPVSRRRFLSASGLAVGAAAAGAALAPRAAAAIPGPGSYSASWASVDRHPPAPQWFQDAKFGIYFHWGAFSVPAYGSEWYGRNMYIAGNTVRRHHESVFGSLSAFPYHYFIDGGRDRSGRFHQFAPKLRSAGGQFDPEEWAQLFANAGAKFAGPVAEHHDGFSMWNSRVNEWNSVGRGPRLDLLQLHARAIRGHGMKLLVAMHHAFNFTGFFEAAPNPSSASLKKLYGKLGSQAENQLWYDKLAEVIDQSQPDIIWQDFNLSRVDLNQRLRFLSYYYNQAVRWNKEVVATYKDGFNTRGEVYDYERGGPGGIVTPYWLTDDSISRSSWSYTSGMRYYDATSVLHAMIDRFSKGGNVLLNISPQAGGVIPDEQRAILGTIGTYLRRFGESVYSTRAWTTYGEGPTRMGGDSEFTAPKAGTSADIRYTRTKQGTVLYATVLGWPGSSVNLSALATNRINLSTLTGVQLLDQTAGRYVNLPKRQQTSAGLRITLPGSAPFPSPAYVLRLTFSGPIPGSGSGGGTSSPGIPTGWMQVTNVANGLVLDGGGTVPTGSPVLQWTPNPSTNTHWQAVDLGTGYHRLVNRTNGMAADSYGQATDGAQVAQAPWNGGNNQQWAIASAGGGQFRLTNRGTGLVMDNNAATTAGSIVVQWTSNPSPHTLWTFRQV